MTKAKHYQNCVVKNAISNISQQKEKKRKSKTNKNKIHLICQHRKKQKNSYFISFLYTIKSQMHYTVSTCPCGGCPSFPSL